MNLSNSLLVASPKEEGTYSFKAVHTYDNKDKVKWTGKANSEHPANIGSGKNANAVTVKEDNAKKMKKSLIFRWFYRIMDYFTCCHYFIFSCII